MKKIVLAAACILAAGVSANAQRPKVDLPDYTFTTVKENPITSVKNQASSGTCWSFSTTSFVESEIIRINGIKDEAAYPDLSEFFTVCHSYSDRGTKYVRLDGNLGFGAGSEGDDVLDIIREYGFVPQSEMTGMNYGTEKPAQAELDAVLKAYLDVIVRNPNRTLTTAWKRGFDGILAAYLGNYPEKFTVNGKEYTPTSYRDALKFNPDDYVSLTSFTHHPFYTKFAIEVCDNWRGDMAYNIPIDELMSVIDNAINNGYTLAWGGDVSDPGFTRDGLALFVDTQAMAVANAPAPGSDQSHWVGSAAPEASAPKAEIKVIEKNPTQESRQIDFDNKTMTDDHGMHLYGIAKDQDGNKFYMIKNSWGETGKYKGIWYASEAFVLGETIDIIVHKDALTKDLKKKLGIQ